jgi:hypothetical protein
MESYVTPDRMYAVVPWTDKKFVLIYNGIQLEDFNSIDEAKEYIKKHKSKVKKPRRQRVKKTNSASLTEFTDKKTK